MDKGALDKFMTGELDSLKKVEEQEEAWKLITFSSILLSFHNHLS